MGQKWPDCDAEIKEFVDSVVRTFVAVIPEKLYSVFLHGSLAMGCFYPPKSDIDLLILVKNQLSINELEQIYLRLVQLTDERPTAGFLELSVVLTRHAKKPERPIPYELHYGEEFPDKIRNGKFDFSQSKGTDPDLAAHFAIAKQRGIALFGPSPKQAFGDIPWEDYLDAVLEDLNWILDERNILYMPFYGVLNCCRVLEMLKKGKGTYSTKEEGALWALDSLPQEHHSIIRFALNCYKSNKPVTSEQLLTGGLAWPEDQLLNFGEYVRLIKDE